MSAELYENMSQAEIIAEMKALMKVLEKKEKAQTKLVEKIEEKKVAAAPARGVRPAQLDKNAKWVEYVHEHILANGWEAFVHTERHGKGMADVEYPESVLMPTEDGEAYFFEGSDGEQPNLSHAMTLSKIYKVQKPELYAEFEAEYVPVAAPGAAVASAAKPPRVSMTLEEKLQEKLEKERMKLEEKEEKKAERERVRAEKKAEKEEEKRLEKMAKEMAKAAKVPKGAVKVVLPKVVKVAVPKAAVASSSLVPKAIARPVAAKPAWVAPPKGEMTRVRINGIAYYVDHLNRVFPPNEQDMPADCVGVYVPATHTISDENVPEDE